MELGHDSSRDGGACAAGSESFWFSTKQIAAHPRTGRPLQRQHAPVHGVFCSGRSVPFTVNRVLRDGPGMFFFDRDYYRALTRIGNRRRRFSEPYRGTAIRIRAGSKSPTRHSPTNPPTRSPLLWRAKVGAARRAGSQGYPPPPKRSGGGGWRRCVEPALETGAEV